MCVCVCVCVCVCACAPTLKKIKAFFIFVLYLLINFQIPKYLLTIKFI